MKAQHTPGDWEYGVSMDDCGEGEITINCGDIYGAAVMPIHGDDFPRDEQEANARLIAAAPELLEACQRIVEGGNIDCGTYWKVDMDDIARICAVIAKATGRE